MIEENYICRLNSKYYNSYYRILRIIRDYYDYVMISLEI